MNENEFLQQMVREGGFAFPSESKVASGGTLTSRGMSLRDWFAGQALTGLLAARATVGDANIYDGDRVCEMAFKCADRMLKGKQS